MSDAELVIAIKADGSGARVIKRDLDEVAKSNTAMQATIKKSNSAFDTMSSRVMAAEKRLLDLSLAGQQGTDRFKRLAETVGNYKTRLAEAERQVGSTERLFSKQSETTKKLTDSFHGLRGALATLAGYLSARAFSQFADNITTIDTRLKNVTGTVQGANRAFDDLFINAQRNGDNISDVVQSYSSLSNVISDSLKQSTDLVKVTDLISRGFAASGASAITAAGATLQLTQGLATNFQAAGQELNSIIEGAPILAKAIAVALGGETAADLKIFAEQGKITSEIFLKALLDSEAAIKAFEIPDTISRSVQRVSNEFVNIGRNSELLKGISGGVSVALNTIADNMDGILKVTSVLVLTSLPALIGLLYTSLPRALAAASAGFASLTAVMMANPFIAVATAITAIISVLFVFREDIAKTMEESGAFTNSLLQAFKDIANGAEIIFKGVATIIGGTFIGIINVVKKAVADLEGLQFKAIDKIANTEIGKKLGIDMNEYALSSASLGMVSKSYSQVFKEGFGSVQNYFEGTFVEDFSKKTDAVGLTKTGAAKTTLPKDAPLAKSLDTVKDKLDNSVSPAVDSLTDKIDRDLADAFKSAFKGSDGGFRKLLDGWKSMFKDFLAEIAYQALARPIVLSVVGSVAGSSSASASTGGSSGGMSSIGNLLSGGSNFMSGLNAPIFGASSTIGQGINSIGASLGLNNSSFIGPMMPGTSNLASSFTGGSALAGVGGNMLANLAFGGKRGVGADIGGTIGGIAGTMIGGPIGAAIGSFLGNAIGGLFGNKKPSNKLQGGALNLADLTQTSYGQTGSKFSEGNKKFVDASLSAASTFAASLKQFGATVTGSVDVSAGDVTGLGLILNGGDRKGFGTDSKAFQTALFQGIIDNLVGTPEDLKTVLKNVKALDQETLAEALGVLELVRAFEDAGKATKPLEDAVKALDAQFKTLKDSATDLGLPTDKLTASYEKQKNALIQNVLSPLQDFLDNQAMSGDSSLNPVQRLAMARSSFDTNLSAIKGGDFANLGDITNQASQLLSVGRDIFASGEAFAALESYVRQSVSGIAGDLGAPNGLNDSVAREISLASAQQISIQQQMLVELQETRAENTKLRKTLERLTNQVVIQA